MTHPVIQLRASHCQFTDGSNAGDFVGLLDPGIAWATLSGTGSDYVFIDNLEFNPTNSTTPEPGSLLLPGSGLLSVAGVIRRKLGVFCLSG
jgi:hypothetical protein